MLHGEGISKEGCLLEMGVANNIVEKSGSWYIYNSEKLGQGENNARQYLKDNPEVADQIECKLREIFMGPATVSDAKAAKAAKAAKEEEAEGKKKK
jgi:recombination protein RecA